MKDTDWEILDSLHRTGNITKTARNLCLSQSAVTKRVQKMETDLGVRILERNSRGVAFTREGEYLSARAAEQMEFMKKIRRDLGEMSAP